MIKDLVTTADLKMFNDYCNIQEARLLQEANLSESQIQIACHNIIKSRYNNLKDNKVNFVQIDNGGKTTIAHKKIKKAEGTAKGFPDVVIWVYKKMSEMEKSIANAGYIHIGKPPSFSKIQIFIEFKRIKSFKISAEQQYWHDSLEEWSEYIYFCNNTVFFEEIICKKIDNFLW